MYKFSRPNQGDIPQRMKTMARTHWQQHHEMVVRLGDTRKIDTTMQAKVSKIISKFL